MGTNGIEVTPELIVNNVSIEEWASLRQRVNDMYLAGPGTERVVELLRANNVIQAIKAYRQFSGCSLIEAKYRALSLMEKMGISHGFEPALDVFLRLRPDDQERILTEKN